MLQSFQEIKKNFEQKGNEDLKNDYVIQEIERHRQKKTSKLGS